MANKKKIKKPLLKLGKIELSQISKIMLEEKSEKEKIELKEQIKRIEKRIEEESLENEKEGKLQQEEGKEEAEQRAAQFSVGMSSNSRVFTPQAIGTEDRGLENNAIELVPDVGTSSGNVGRIRNNDTTGNISYSSRSDFDRGYSVSSTYQSEAGRVYRTREEEARTAPILSFGETRNSEIVNPFGIRMADRQASTGRQTEDIEKRQIEEFERQQEELKMQVQNQSGLPFQRRKRGTRKIETF